MCVRWDMAVSSSGHDAMITWVHIFEIAQVLSDQDFAVYWTKSEVFPHRIFDMALSANHCLHIWVELWAFCCCWCHLDQVSVFKSMEVTPVLQKVYLVLCHFDYIIDFEYLLLCLEK